VCRSRSRSRSRSWSRSFSAWAADADERPSGERAPRGLADLA
jgi:hypothetical protein